MVCRHSPTQALFDQWVDDRHVSILTYRDQKAVSSVSNVASLSFGMPWVKMFTDDKEVRCPVWDRFVGRTVVGWEAY
jgi:hypothetical protein